MILSCARNRGSYKSCPDSSRLQLPPALYLVAFLLFILLTIDNAANQSTFESNQVYALIHCPDVEEIADQYELPD